MDMNSVISIIAIAIAIGALAYAFYKSGVPVTVEGVTTTLQELPPLADDIRTELEMIVLGVDQLTHNGDINTDDEAFQKAFAVAQKRWPGIDPEALAVFIEGVYNVTLGRNKPAPVTPTPKSEGQLLADITAKELLGVDVRAGDIPL